VAFTKFRTAQPFGPYLHQGNNLDVVAACGTFMALTSTFSVEPPGIEPDALPGLLAFEQAIRYVSFRLSPVR
jgi:hypothetical protein